MARRKENCNESEGVRIGLNCGRPLMTSRGQGLVAVSGVLSTGLVVFCLFMVGEARDLGEAKMPAKKRVATPPPPNMPVRVSGFS